MFEITDFLLHPLDDKQPRSALWLNGKDTGLVVDGLVLEKQLQVSAGYLLLITENCPYEEGLHIYLLDKDLRMLDGIELAKPYSSAILSAFNCKGDDECSFSFFGTERWQLKITQIPKRIINVAWFSAIRHKGSLLPYCWLSLELHPATTGRHCR